MKIGKIADLFSSVSQQQQQQAVRNDDAKATQNQAAQNRATSSDTGATRIAEDFGKTSPEEEAAQAKRLSDITERVKNKTYNPSSTDIASAVYRDLLA